MLGLLFACSDAKLQPVQEEGPPPVDDRLEIRGSICTQPPEDEFLPVKVLFVVDTSDSERVTDPTRQRVQAVLDVIDRYAGNPSVEFAVLAFDSVVSNITNGFTSTPDIQAITNRLTAADRLTDYQGALGSVYTVLSQDMVASSPTERARSKYVIVFFSDGNPDPQCLAGAAQQQLLVCSVPRDEWPDTFVLPTGTNPNTGQPWTWEDFQGLYPDLRDGADYNTKAQLVSKVQDILELQEIYNVNEVRFHTGFLFDPNLPSAFIQAFGLDRAEGIDLMGAMATAGNGTFTEFTSGATINFLNVNYASTKRIYDMTNFYAINQSTIADGATLRIDSDADGLFDELEDSLKLCSFVLGGVNCNLGGGRFANPLDTDGDGYQDFFEYVNRSSGFDPKRAATQTTPCRATDDSDGDGLRDCEENFLGTDMRLSDSDADRMLDGIELRNGLNPLDPTDALADTDSDGRRNLDEVLAHLNPTIREPSDALLPQVKYEITLTAEHQDGRKCYTFVADNIRLRTTRSNRPVERGLNRITVAFLEGPKNDVRDFGSARVACVEARYVEPDFKDPADGVIELSETDFYSPTDPARKCVGGGSP